MNLEATETKGEPQSPLTEVESPPPEGPQEGCLPTVPRSQELIDNIPYLAMIVMGALLFWSGFANSIWRWPAAGIYVAYGLGGVIWIMCFICPYCRFYDTRLCPCGYGQLATKLRAPKAHDRFASQFKKHIPVIVSLWFAPLIPGGIDFSRLVMCVVGDGEQAQQVLSAIQQLHNDDLPADGSPNTVLLLPLSDLAYF